MLYEKNLKQSMLDVLFLRTSSIADCIQALFEEGYSPNKKKKTILSWTSILIDAYENIDVLSKEQQNNLDRIFNTVLKL